MSASQTTGSRLFAMVSAEEGRTTSALAALLGQRSANVSSTLKDIERNGWIVSRLENRTGARGAPFFARWYLTEKGRTVPYPAMPYMDTPDRIMALLGESAVPVEAVAQQLGRSYHTVRSAVRRMQERADVETYTERGVLYVRRPLGELEDDGWQPPTQYMSAARAYALGLKGAAA
ncbi:MAG: hypothetical protein HEQ38_17240 [Gemmatimonas sp.]|nr:hypothetical protein [Gemmatimonas sp.]